MNVVHSWILLKSCVPLSGARGQQVNMSLDKVINGYFELRLNTRPAFRFVLSERIDL